MGSEQTVLKCKCCGDTLQFAKGAKICVCESCGSTQTLPSSAAKYDDYARADRLRRDFEFDEAMTMYTQIIREEPEDPEGYWNYLLCKYGVEYVQEGNEHKPTIHRMQQRSITEEEDYKSALEYADDDQRALYEKEAAEIDRISSRFRELCNDDEFGNYDVFISYKDTELKSDDKTWDYREAYNLYDYLKDKHYKVFFSAVTLQSIAGADYEPYIYAALHSAKVMVLFGSKPEYINAPWVKNEWSRYREIIKDDRNRILIPVCRPTDLPAEFGHIQSVDISKPSYDVDVKEAIRKKIGKKEEAYQANIGRGLGKNDIKKRIEQNLLAGKWDDVKRNARIVLDMDRTDADAYLSRLLADNRVSQIAELKGLNTPVYESDDFKNAAEYGSAEIKKGLSDAEEAIKSNIAALEERDKLLYSMYGVSATLLHNYDSVKKMIGINEEKIAELKKEKHSGINPAAGFKGFLVMAVVIVIAWIVLMAIPATSHFLETALAPFIGPLFESLKEKLSNGWYILAALFGFPIALAFILSIIVFFIIPLIVMIIGGVNRNKTIAAMEQTGEDLKKAMHGFAGGLTAVFAYVPQNLRNEAALNELSEVCEKKEKGRRIEDYAAQPSFAERFKGHEDFRKIIYRQDAGMEELLKAAGTAFDADKQFNTPAFRSQLQRI